MILSLFLSSLNVSNYHIVDSMTVKLIVYKFNSDSSRKELYRNQIEVSDDFVFDPRNFYSVFSLLYPGSYLEFTLLLNY